MGLGPYRTLADVDSEGTSKGELLNVLLDRLERRHASQWTFEHRTFREATTRVENVHITIRHCNIGGYSLLIGRDIKFERNAAIEERLKNIMANFNIDLTRPWAYFIIWFEEQEEYYIAYFEKEWKLNRINKFEKISKNVAFIKLNQWMPF